MFEDITVESIKQRILGRLSTSLQTREGSFTNDVISAVAVELHDCYHRWDSLRPQFYIDETSGQYIDLQAGTVGIVRKPGTVARCTITFTGSDGARVPAGAPFYTDIGLAFYLESDVVLDGGAGIGTLLAAEPGDAYNIDADAITSTLRNYTGVSSYANEQATGGTDPESDAALVTRYYERMRRSPTSGNPYHYQMWAGSVAGVGSARVISKWNGPGTVKVVLASPEMAPVGEGVVAEAAAYIETQRPVGPEVTVTSAVARNIAVTASVQLDGSTDTATVKAALSAAVAAYLRELAAGAFAANVDLQMETLSERSYTVLYNRIAFLLLSVSGVIDYTSLTVNGGTANIVVGAEELPVLTEVTVT